MPSSSVYGCESRNANSSVQVYPGQASFSAFPYSGVCATLDVLGRYNAMEVGDAVLETSQRLLHGREFASFDAFEDTISSFTEEMGYHFKPVNLHKLPAGSPTAETSCILQLEVRVRFGLNSTPYRL
nr:unnamed protein product [Spirometra erinaceieuropaei]